MTRTQQFHICRRYWWCNTAFDTVPYLTHEGPTLHPCTVPNWTPEEGAFGLRSDFGKQREGLEERAMQGPAQCTVYRLKSDRASEDGVTSPLAQRPQRHRAPCDVVALMRLLTVAVLPRQPGVRCVRCLRPHFSKGSSKGSSLAGLFRNIAVCPCQYGPYKARSRQLFTCSFADMCSFGCALL